MTDQHHDFDSHLEDGETKALLLKIINENKKIRKKLSKQEKRYEERIKNLEEAVSSSSKEEFLEDDFSDTSVNSAIDNFFELWA